MTFLNDLKDRVEDFIYTIKLYKWRNILVCVCLIVGMILGIVFCSGTLNKDSKMIGFVDACYYGNFLRVLIVFSVWLLISYAITLLPCIFSKLTFIHFPFSFVLGLKAGHNIYALIFFCGIWGLFCSLLVVFVQCFFDLLTLMLSYNDCNCNNSLKEAVYSSKTTIILQLLSLMLRLIFLFLILRL